MSIEVPEHIVFRHMVAGPARRAVAQIVDLVVCYSAVLLLSFVVIFTFAGFGGIRGALESVGDASVGFILVLAFAAQWLYSFLWEGLTGRSPGKMLLRLRVVTLDGRPIGLAASALRNVMRAADILPGAYLVGVATMALNRRFQRLGDLTAGTMVVTLTNPSKSAPLVLWPPATPVEIAVIPDFVPLDVDERAAIELFLRRRPSLGPAREQELATILMVPLEERFGFRLPDASRTLALLYDRAVNAGRTESPPSSRTAPARGRDGRAA